MAIKATAGSGKTTTLIQISKLLPVIKKVHFAAFNKAISNELKYRLRGNIGCSTLHSLGMSAIMSHYRESVKLNDFKTFLFVDDVIKGLEFEKREEKLSYQFPIVDLVNYARMTLTDWDKVSLKELSDRYGVLLSNEDQLTFAIETLEKLHYYNSHFTSKKRTVDFIDMVYIPATLQKLDVSQFDVMLIDEGQDLNLCQHKMIERMTQKANSRIIFVGDYRQSIYSFMGADINSFNRFSDREGVINLPLSVSYRCGKKIVELSQSIYPEIEPYENNHDGCVRHGAIDELKNGDMVLCRNTRPLVALYFELLQDHKTVSILGKDIGKNLINFINKFGKDVTAKQVIDGLYEGLNQIVFELKSKGVKRIKDHDKYLNYLEKLLVIKIISKNLIYCYQIEETINKIFVDIENIRTDGITLSTIHKSKGLESDRVFIIRKDLLPSKYAVQDWQKVQEKNLEFVMVTRAKKELIYADEWSDE